MTTGPAPRRENAFTLVRRLVAGTVSLAKLEVQRGREEMGRNLAQLRGGIILLAIAAAIVFVFVIGLIAFIMAVFVAIGLWWVDLILLVLLLVVAFLLGRSGIGKVTSTSFTPEETIASVKEDVEWLKSRVLRRS